MRFKFECKDCGASEAIDNPTITEKKCVCGGKKILIPIGFAIGSSRVEPRVDDKFQGGASLGQVICELKGRPGKVLRKYKVLICDHCKKPQMTSASRRMKCVGCGGFSKFWIDGKLRDVLFHTDSPAQAAIWTRELEAVCERIRRTGNGAELAWLAVNFKESGKLRKGD